MSTAINGAAAPAATTAVDGAQPSPGREAVLKSFAADILASAHGTPAGAAEKAPGHVAGGEPNDLSNRSTEVAAPPATEAKAAAPGTEPQWTPQQQKWFDDRTAAQTPEQIAAVEAAVPEFTPEQMAWLETQEAASAPGEPDHLADDAELKGKLDAATQGRINARIGKEVAKTKAAQERVTALETQTRQLEERLALRPAGSPDARTGLANVHDGASLQKVEGECREAVAQADDGLRQLRHNPAAVERMLREAKVSLKDAEGNEDYSPERMRSFLEDVRSSATTRLTRDVPQRAKFLTQVNASMGEAFTVLPALKDRNSDERRIVNQFLAENPQVRQMANWPIGLAKIIAYDALMAKQPKPGARSQNAPVKRPLPPRIPSPRGMTPATVPQPRPGTVTDDVVQKALDGDKSARLKYLSQFVPQ